MLRVFLFFALGTGLGATVATANGASGGNADAPPEIKNVLVGFGNHYKLGCWTPVSITLSEPAGNSAAAGHFAGRIDVQAVDGDGVPVWFVGPFVSAGEGLVHTAYVRVGRADRPIRIRLTKGTSTDEATSEPPSNLAVAGIALPATNQFIVEFGASIGLPEMSRRFSQNEAERTTVVTADAPQQLPTEWYGYDGVDLVVIAGAPAVEKSVLSAPAVDALEKWVRQGGKLLVCCGDGAEHVLGTNGLLARFAPGELVGVANLPAARFGAIENFAAAEQRLEAASIRVPQWKNIGVDHRIELSGGGRADDLPLVVRWPLGFGQVIFVGLDLDRAPFTDWPSRGKFLEKLLAKNAPLGGQITGSRAANQGKQLGYIDLAGQLRGALDQFHGVQLIPFWAITLLALTYLVLLFPLSYWIVTRWLRRQTLAWVIFPVTVITFCAAAYALASYSKGNLLHVNQVDLLDLDAATGSARGSTWFTLFSPKNALHDLRVTTSSSGQTAAVGPKSESAGAAHDSVPLLGWFGLPGTGLGGMNSAAVNPPLFDEPYTIDPARGTISSVPLAVWSSQSFVARWQQDKRPSGGGALEAALTATADRRLRGTLASRLDFSLRDCILLFDRWAYSLGTLEPGKSLALDRMESQTIDTYLTKRRTIAARDEVPPYDRTSFDVLRIIEIMMFHDAAGGSNYTGLLHRYQRYTDLTSQLQFGRAVLVGRGPNGCQLQIDGQPAPENSADRHVSIYRFVIPVPAPGGI